MTGVQTCALPIFDEGLDVGVVLGDLLEQALAQQVDAGVVDIEYSYLL